MTVLLVLQERQRGKAGQDRERPNTAGNRSIGAGGARGQLDTRGRRLKAKPRSVIVRFSSRASSCPVPTGVTGRGPEQERLTGVRISTTRNIYENSIDCESLKPLGQSVIPDGPGL